jgi:bacterioferritin-associated ferredoxin
MEPDEAICLCFHITRRKVANFIRIEKPKRAAQLSECFGAGTGCGWCRPYLLQMFVEAVEDGHTHLDLPPAEEYARLRAKYIRAGGGTPPPHSTPLDETPGDG